MVNVLLDDRKLVTAQAGDGVFAAHATPQPLANLLEEPVAHGMAERVIDLLETVEIKPEHRDRSIRIGGVEVVLNSSRNQALGLELFTNLGIDPRQKRLVVVKSTNHFMASFGPIAKRVIYVEADGPLSRDYTRMPFRKVNRPIWPLDADTKPGLIL